MNKTKLTTKELEILASDEIISWDDKYLLNRLKKQYSRFIKFEKKPFTIKYLKSFYKATLNNLDNQREREFRAQCIFKTLYEIQNTKNVRFFGQPKNSKFQREMTLDKLPQYLDALKSINSKTYWLSQILKIIWKASGIKFRNINRVNKTKVKKTPKVNLNDCGNNDYKYVFSKKSKIRELLNEDLILEDAIYECNQDDSSINDYISSLQDQETFELNEKGKEIYKKLIS